MNKTYAFGVMLVLTGGAFLSLSGILLRHVEAASGWQIQFYRSIATFVTLLIILVAIYRKDTVNAFLRIGAPGLLAAAVLGAGSTCYIFAMLFTTVANVVFIIGAAPLITALVGWLFLREKITLGSLATMAVAFAGIGLMFTDGVITGNWAGNLMALMVALSFVGYLVIIRGRKRVDMVPATCLAGLASALMVTPMIDGFHITLNDLLIAIILGAAQFSFGFMLLTIGARYLIAAEVALFSLSEAVLNPLWVWIGVGETPSTLTLYGSAIVFLAVVVYCIAAIRRTQRQFT